nr:MAG TPA: Protein of unknown function (DUF1642) [Caudoviricetes sp.]
MLFLPRLRRCKVNKRELIEHIDNTLFDNLKDTLFTEPTLSITESAKDNKVAITFETEQGGVLLGGMLKKFEKVTVPQFVADWIKYCKCTGVELQHALNMEDLYFYNYANQKDDLKLKEFFETENNQDLFARAWLDGYEIEKEKQYLVKIKATKHFFARDGLRRIFFSLGYKSWFTREELEQAGFGWVFDCPGIEIEEVE